MIEEKTEAAKKLEEAKAEAAKTTTKPTMRIKVYSPFKTYFEDDGYSISGVNATGPFDILPHHHNFMTLLSACELSIQTLGRSGQPPQQKIRISGGLMHVKADKVTVFLDI
jgi:F0F1-type ATP synthase epsilon subunit